MEAGRDRRRRRPRRSTSAAAARTRSAPCSSAALDPRPRYRAGLARVDPLLQLDRGLPLVADHVAHAGTRGDRVEQPARRWRSAARAGADRAATAGPRARRAARRTGSAGRVAVRPPGTPPPSATAAGSPPRRRAAAPAPGGRPAGSRARSATSTSPPQSVPSGPKPVPSRASPITGPASPLSARQDAMCAWWCCTPTSSTPSPGSSAYAGGQVVRVQVVRDQHRVDVEQPPVVLDPLGVRAVGLPVLQVADVVGEHGPAGPASRQNVLFSSAPQASTGRRAGHGQRQRLGRVPAGPADRQRPAADDPDDRVVDPGVDRPVVA